MNYVLIMYLSVGLVKLLEGLLSLSPRTWDTPWPKLNVTGGLDRHERDKEKEKQKCECETERKIISG